MAIRWTKARRKAHGELIRKRLASKKQSSWANTTSFRGNEPKRKPFEYIQIQEEWVVRCNELDARIVLLEKMNGFGRLLRKCGVI